MVDDLNADVAEGFGRLDTNIANGRRASTAVAYVQPARRHGNLELLSVTMAARIVIEGNRARGVEIIRNGVSETIGAEREIILCGVAPALDAVGYRASRSPLSPRYSDFG